MLQGGSEKLCELCAVLLVRQSGVATSHRSNAGQLSAHLLHSVVVQCFCLAYIPSPFIKYKNCSDNQISIWSKAFTCHNIDFTQRNWQYALNELVNTSDKQTLVDEQNLKTTSPKLFYIIKSRNTLAIQASGIQAIYIRPDQLSTCKNK